jgi:chemotaxis signal transduction protein
MQIARHIRRMVTFSFLNLAEDSYPSLVNNTNAMDIVLCRNVLMYFTPETASRVVEKLRDALLEHAWLLVAPSETSQALFRQFEIVDFPDVMIYRKPPGPFPRPSVESATVVCPGPSALQEEPLSGEGIRLEVPTTPQNAVPTDSPIVAAQALANRGELAEALGWCDGAVLADPLNPAHRFLRAMVAQELGRLDEAMRSLEQALYLDQDFIMAYFALGNLAKRLGRHARSRRHFDCALSLLEGLEPDVAVPESAGEESGRTRDMLEVVAFVLRQEKYGIETRYIREVCPLNELTPLPGAPSFVLGIVNVRGRVLSVIDIGKLFDLPQRGVGDLDRIIVLQHEGMEFAILGNAILGVVRVPADELQPSLPTLTGLRGEYLRGVTRDRMAILDGARLLADENIVVREEA